MACPRVLHSLQSTRSDIDVLSSRLLYFPGRLRLDCGWWAWAAIASFLSSSSPSPSSSGSHRLSSHFNARSAAPIFSLSSSSSVGGCVRHTCCGRLPRRWTVWAAAGGGFPDWAGSDDRDGGEPGETTTATAAGGGGWEMLWCLAPPPPVFLL